MKEGCKVAIGRCTTSNLKAVHLEAALAALRGEGRFLFGTSPDVRWGAGQAEGGGSRKSRKAEAADSKQPRLRSGAAFCHVSTFDFIHPP